MIGVINAAGLAAVILNAGLACIDPRFQGEASQADQHHDPGGARCALPDPAGAKQKRLNAGDRQANQEDINELPCQSRAAADPAG
jgi:hypothetical protein